MDCPQCGWSLKELENTSHEMGSFINYHLICNDCGVYITVSMDKQKYVEKCLKYNKVPNNFKITQKP
jgi:uncharacterized Zn finger protein